MQPVSLHSAVRAYELRGWFFLLLLMDIGAAASRVIVPLLSGWIIDSLIAGDSQKFRDSTVFLSMILGAGVALGYTCARVSQWAGLRLELLLRSTCMERIWATDYTLLGELDRSRIHSRILVELRPFRLLFSPSVLSMPASVLQVFAVLALCATTHIVLGIAAACLFLITIIVSRGAASWQYFRSRSEVATWSTLSSTTFWAIGPSQHVVTGARRDLLKRAWLLDSSAYSHAAMGLVRLNTAVSAAYMTLLAASSLLTFSFGGHMVIEGRLSPGELVAYAGLISGLFAPAISLASAWRAFAEIRVAWERLQPILTLPLSKRALMSGEDLVDVLLRDVEVRTSSMSRVILSEHSLLGGEGLGVGERGAVILSSCSLRLRRGESLAVVGSSGSGKSTLCQVLAGLIQPASGTVSIPEWASPVRLVHADEELGGNSVVDAFRLCVGDDGLNAARSVLEQYCTVFDECGSLEEWLSRPLESLSRGQRQWLIIRLALLERPGLLILDEATSGFDSILEGQIFSEASSLCDAIVLVTHRRDSWEMCMSRLTWNGSEWIQVHRS